MAKVKSESSQRLKALLGILFAVLLIGLAVLAYQLTRTVDFSWEQSNAVEANEAARKLKLLNSSVASGKKGFVRLSQLEINSYLMAARTNPVPPGRVAFKDVKIDLTRSNFTLVSFGELSIISKWSVPITMMRSFHIEQDGTNQWAFPLDYVQIGDVTIPRKIWPYVSRIAKRLDEPLGPQFVWATNLPALRLAKNEISGDPELRLYTYKPVLAD